jgi:polygalacturonase
VHQTGYGQTTSPTASQHNGRQPVSQRTASRVGIFAGTAHPRRFSGYDNGTFLDGTYQRKATYGRNKTEGPTGRLKFGTESNGDYKNITISNVIFGYCRGLALETVDGGLLEDVTIANVTMRDIWNAPIFLRPGSRPAPRQHQQFRSLQRRPALRFHHQRHPRSRH